MRGTLLVCALAAAQAKQVPNLEGYNECEYFITAIYNGIVDDWYDAPNITLVAAGVADAWTRTLNTPRCRHDRGLRGDDPKPDRLARRAARARRDPGARRRQGPGDDNRSPLFAATQHNT